MKRAVLALAAMAIASMIRSYAVTTVCSLEPSVASQQVVINPDADTGSLSQAPAIAVIEQLGLIPERVNVNGGAVALGHPIGASGARILVTLLHEMARRESRRGIATLCLGGGNAVALAVER